VFPYEDVSSTEVGQSGDIPDFINHVKATIRRSSVKTQTEATQESSSAADENERFASKAVILDERYGINWRR
jgi:hypothetical protein